MNIHLRYTKQKYLKIVLSVLALVGVFTMLPQLAFAESSKIHQEIIAVGCDHDTYETGLGNVHSPACPAFVPVISSYKRLSNGGYMAYGAFDATHTDINPVTGRPRLNVTFLGRVFTLGIDSELRVDGNAWILDLSAWRGSPDDSPAGPVSPDQAQPVEVIDSQVTTTMQPDSEGNKQSLSGKAAITMPSYPKNTTESIDCSKGDAIEACQLDGRLTAATGLVFILSGLVAIETALLLIAYRERRRKDG